MSDLNAPPCLEIANLHLRHPGIPPGLSLSYHEVAVVCLERHHTSPATWVVEVWQQREARYRVEWAQSTDTVRRGYANSDDATRDGAYALALSAADHELNLTAFLRSDTRTGCDWYLAPGGGDGAELDLDSEGVVRLEVSGIDRDDRARLLARVSRKLDQLAAVASAMESIAGVVGFGSGTIMFRSLR